MKKKSRVKPDPFASLITEVRDLILSARRGAVAAVNTLQVMTNFEIGRRIVEHEQKGANRAEYGDEVVKGLAQVLTSEFGAGFSLTNLKLMRKFYALYKSRIGQTPSDLSLPRLIGQTASRHFSHQSSFQIKEKPSVKLAKAAKPQAPSVPIAKRPAADLINPFSLSWSHYVLLLTVADSDERSFYEIEAARENWSLSELKRQKASALYQRLLLSRDKAGVKRLATEGQVVEKPEDMLKEPYVLEFLGLDEQAGYSESDLESAIISNLERFLLELGKGFLFEARQKRFTFDEDHYFVDLVFYNRLLRCYVIIDLKLDKLIHQDLGQMQMYVNYYDRHVKLADENPTIGLLLCKEKKNAVVELTLPRDANIHAREYQLYLPSKELLKQKLLEWTRAEEARRR